jgi:hypothetical protein
MFQICAAIYHLLLHMEFTSRNWFVMQGASSNYSDFLKINIFDIFVETLSLYMFTIWTSIVYNLFCRDRIYFDKILVSEYKLFKRCRYERRRFGALKSDSTHYFFRNACTKSWSLRFSQFSGCWLILSVYILMSFSKCQTLLRHTLIKKYFWHFCFWPLIFIHFHYMKIHRL